MAKKAYEPAQMELIELEAESVVIASGGGCGLQHWCVLDETCSNNTEGGDVCTTESCPPLGCWGEND